MKKLVFLCATSLLIMLPSALVAGCQQPTTPTLSATESPIGNKTYTNSEYRFSVEYSADWDMKKNLTDFEKSTGVVAIFEGPSSPEYDYRVNIVIEAENLSAEITADEYASGVEEYILKKNLPNYTNLQEQKTTVGGLPAIIRVFTATIKGIPHKYIQAYFTKENIGYAITYDATTDLYDKYVDFFDLAISTFKFQ